MPYILTVPLRPRIRRPVEKVDLTGCAVEVVPFWSWGYTIYFASALLAPLAAYLVFGFCVAGSRWGANGDAWLISLWLPPLVLPVVILVLGAKLFQWRVRSAGMRKFERPRDLQTALKDGGDAVLCGTLQAARIDKPVPLLVTFQRASMARLANRTVAVDASIAQAERRALWGVVARASWAEDFSVQLDDGTVVLARGGQWRVFDPFSAGVSDGVATLSAGDRIMIRARVEFSPDAAPSDGYRRAESTPILLPDGGYLAPAQCRYPERPKGFSNALAKWTVAILLWLLVSPLISLGWTVTDSMAERERGARRHPPHATIDNAANREPSP